MSYIIENVEILYPRINQPYKFDQAAGENGKSVPCDPFDEGAKYETKFRMDKDQAKALYGQMDAAYQKAKEKGWPEKIDFPFEKQEDSSFVGKAVLKAAYGKDATNPPKQFDAKSKELPEDFKLTTGSTANVAVTFYPYNMRDAGVSVRLRAVQVIKYLPMEAASPFGVVADGFEMDSDNPFETVSPVAEAPKAVVSDDLFGDDTAEEAPVEQPKKTAKKKSVAPKQEDKDLASIVDNWDG
mgnify:FL=1|jgi:hypothetical protein|tara:strand:+ start:1037 stop:1759 length:723 start_codon:yes stop_codon:yes gene_type:complete